MQTTPHSNATPAGQAGRLATCDDCGAAIPRSDRLCEACASAHDAPPAPRWHTAVHWLILIVVMTAIIGIGALFTA